MARILLVEDQEALREILAEAIELFGHKVVSRPSGMEAMETFGMDPGFDLVIMDFAMPGMDGFRLLTLFDLFL